MPALCDKSWPRSNLRRNTQHQPPGTPEVPCLSSVYRRRAPGETDLISSVCSVENLDLREGFGRSDFSRTGIDPQNSMSD